MPDSLLLASGLQFGFSNSTLSGLVICAVLGLLSIASWATIVSKFRFLSRVRRSNSSFQHALGESIHPLSIFQLSERYDLSPMYHIYNAGCRELCFHLLGIDEPDHTFAKRMKGAGRITPVAMAAVHEAMDRAVGEAALKMESRMSIVATALSGAPFLGLLGTVWGVMDSFGGLASSSGDTTLRALAPGLAAALLTTVVGLLVAIPSMFGYNFLVSKIRDQITRLDSFAADFGSIVERLFVDHRQPQEALPSLGSLGSPSLPAAFSTAPGVAMSMSAEPQMATSRRT
jgi:biopolymer transport protein TolQ